MKRLYFLVPELSTSHQIVNALRSHGIDDHHIHVVAGPGTPLDDIPQVTLKEKSYLLPAMKKGAGYGGTMGLLIGLLAMHMPGAVLAGGALALMGMLGAGMGGFVGSLLGADQENVHVKSLESAIADGQLLLLADVDDGRVTEIEALIKAHYPDARLETVEPTMPDYPY